MLQEENDLPPFYTHYELQEYRQNLKSTYGKEGKELKFLYSLIIFLYPIIKQFKAVIVRHTH